jgi:hypothetical protein
MHGIYELVDIYPFSNHLFHNVELQIAKTNNTTRISWIFLYINCLWLQCLSLQMHLALLNLNFANPNMLLNLTFVFLLTLVSNVIFGIGWKYITVTPFGVSHCIAFQGYACLSVSHLKLLKDFHNFFAYYVRI